MSNRSDLIAVMMDIVKLRARLQEIEPRVPRDGVPYRILCARSALNSAYNELHLAIELQTEPTLDHVVPLRALDAPGMTLEHRP